MNCKRFASLLLVFALVFALAAIPQAGALDGKVGLSEAEAVIYTKEEIGALDTGVYNFNADWLYYEPPSNAKLGGPLSSVLEQVKDSTGKYFYEVGFDDAAWEQVSVPHAFNAKYMYQSIATSGGDRGAYQGYVFYRKHFTLPAGCEGKKVFIEFEGIRQASYVYLNGKMIGYYEAGVTAFGFDLSAGDLNYTGENVLAVAADNRSSTNTPANPAPADNGIEETHPDSVPGAQDGTGYQWSSTDFNPNQGGITRDVKLHIKGNVYQTLPLYRNLRTQGVYIYPSNIDVSGKTATIHVEAEVRNETSVAANISMDVVLIDRDGEVAYSESFAAAAVTAANDVADNAKINMTALPADDPSFKSGSTNASWEKVDYTFRDATVLAATFDVAGLNLWSTYDPYLYDVYTVLKNGEEIIDVVKTTTGFRKVVFQGGEQTGGVFLNDEFVWLTGYAQRSTNEWAAIGVASDWLADWEMSLVRESNANFIRWMHVAPPPNTIRAGDKYGIVSAVPAGDKENGNCSSRQWNQRMEVMRDVILYFRNNPSVLFWEIGNSSPDDASRLSKMADLKKALDPSGMRAIGCRSVDTEAKAKLLEYVGTMLGRKITTGGSAYQGAGRAIVATVPIMETEYTRDEAPRRVWDRFSPPDFNYMNQWSGNSGATPPGGLDAWDMTAEEFVIANTGAYYEFYSRRLQANSAAPIYSAAAALCWSDSNQHGRQTYSETGRMSGRVDPVRILKQSYYAYQAMQSEAPSVYLVGHWNYPTDPNAYVYHLRDQNYNYTDQTALRDATNKTVYVVAANVSYVELFVNGVSKGIRNNPRNGFLYAWDGIDVTQNGKIEAVGFNALGVEQTRMLIETVGAPAALRLTPKTGPEGFLADGSDLAFIDVEVVDSAGRVHPLNYDKISFEITAGADKAEIMGGYNSGREIISGNHFSKGYNKSYFFAENGANRLFIKAGRTAGEVTVKFTLHLSDGGTLENAVTLTLSEFSAPGGLSKRLAQSARPDEFPPRFMPTYLPGMQPVLGALTVDFESELMEFFEETVIDNSIATTIDGVPVDLGVDDDGNALAVLDYGLGMFAPALQLLDHLTGTGLTYSFNRAAPEDIRIMRGNTMVRLVIQDSTFYVKEGSGPEQAITPLNNMADYINGVFYIEPEIFLTRLGYTFTYDAVDKTLTITTTDP